MSAEIFEFFSFFAERKISLRTLLPVVENRYRNLLITDNQFLIFTENFGKLPTDFAVPVKLRTLRICNEVQTLCRVWTTVIVQYKIRSVNVYCIKLQRQKFCSIV